MLARAFVARALAAAGVALTLAVASAQAAEPHPHVGKLPGFPAMRGVVPVLGSSAAVAARERLVTGAFAAARERSLGSNGSKGTSEPNTKFIAKCTDQAAFQGTQDVCYRGGPVLHDPTIHLIFWQGGGESFPAGYGATVEQYLEDLTHDSGSQTNVFAVDRQYGEELSAGKFVAGEYALSFSRSTDVTVDSTPFPPLASTQCKDEVPEHPNSPCLLDSDIQKEVAKVAETSEKGLRDVYLVMTPPGVGGCFEASSGQCAYAQYCAYHGDFGGDGVTVGKQTLYADIPFVGEVAGCDSEVHPNALADNGADAAIDDVAHELTETVADPIGSQCKSGAIGESECEHNAWTDVIGQEVADKCLPPESTVEGTYGEPLGELLPGDEASSYNQLIDGNHYWTQRVWSNEAGVLEGGCVQRMIGASFSVSPGAAATVPATFDGSSSGAPGDPAVYWVWNFEGEQIGTYNPTTAFAFGQPGEHVVTLTAYDAYGNGQATAEAVVVGAAPIPSPPPAPPPVPAPVLIKEALSPAHYTAAQLAVKLGLPSNGRKLAGSGRIALGHSECPPACGVTLRLYASVAAVTHGKRTTKLVSIGGLHLALAAKGNRALSLTLGANARTLLRKARTLPCRLQVTVEGPEGGIWQIVRSLTLTR